jgi:hypothetical protein
MLKCMNLRRAGMAALAIATATYGAAGAIGQTAAQTATLRTIGIVEIPRLFNRFSPEGTLLPPGGRIDLLAHPQPDGQVVATVTSGDILEAREYGYEETGALVFARDGGWYLVKTTEGVTGWLAPADSGPFHSLESLLEDGLTYLTAAWDGFLSTAPDGGDRVRPPADPNRLLVGFVTPVLQRIAVVPGPGQDAEEVARQYRSLSVGSRRAPDGTVVLSVEIGVVLPLFESPSVLSPKVTHIETNPAGEGLEADGSPPRVAVFEAQPGWFQVALRRADYRNATRAWLQASALWRFVPAKDEADARELAERMWGPEDLSVRVVGLQTVDGALWAHVELMSASECVSSVRPTLRARGWVPAHAASGEPTIWFSSRGC